MKPFEYNNHVLQLCKAIDPSTGNINPNDAKMVIILRNELLAESWRNIQKIEKRRSMKDPLDI